MKTLMICEPTALATCSRAILLALLEECNPDASNGRSAYSARAEALLGHGERCQAVGDLRAPGEDGDAFEVGGHPDRVAA